MAVCDISLGGFAVEAPVRFAHGESYEFLLHYMTLAAVPIRARAAYCHPAPDGTHQFITGWEALGDPLTTQSMTSLVDALTAGLASDAPAIVDAAGQAYDGTSSNTGSL